MHYRNTHSYNPTRDYDHDHHVHTHHKGGCGDYRPKKCHMLPYRVRYKKISTLNIKLTISKMCGYNVDCRHPCSYCGKILGAPIICGGCKYMFYCSSECRQLSWDYGRHSKYCGLVLKIRKKTITKIEMLRLMSEFTPSSIKNGVLLNIGDNYDDDDDDSDEEDYSTDGDDDDDDEYNSNEIFLSNGIESMISEAIEYFNKLDDNDVLGEKYWSSDFDDDDNNINTKIGDNIQSLKKEIKNMTLSASDGEKYNRSVIENDLKDANNLTSLLQGELVGGRHYGYYYDDPYYRGGPLTYHNPLLGARFGLGPYPYFGIGYRGRGRGRRPYYRRRGMRNPGRHGRRGGSRRGRKK